MADKRIEEELKTQDKLQLLFSQFMAYLSENKKKALISIAVICFTLLGISGWFFYQADYEKSAQKLYAKAHNNSMNNKGGAQDILKLFKDVTTQYPNSNAALLAHYRLGSYYFYLNDIDSSIASYQMFLKDSPEDTDLVPLAYTGLGYCYESKGDYKSALQYYEKADKSKAGITFESMNNRNIARIYEALNDRAKALEYYQKALGKTSDPLVERFIKRKISMLLG
jgi:tetratricopeptide (TPR) repeat protein